MEQIEPRSSNQPLYVQRPLRSQDCADVLGAGALTFVGVLASRFEAERHRLVVQRGVRQVASQAKDGVGFLPETRFVRDSAWRVAPAPAELAQRGVRVAEPLDTAWASATCVEILVADFGHRDVASFDDVVTMHRRLRQAVRDGASAERGGALAACPRGLHLADEHFRVAGEALGGALVDVGLYLFHNAHALLRRGTAPYVCLAGLEHYLEARWWCQVIEAAEYTLGLARATVKVSVRIETPPAVFQMHELLYELRERGVGLQCPPWDEVFTSVEGLQPGPGRALSPREQLSMSRGFVTALSARTCEQRGATLIADA